MRATLAVSPGISRHVRCVTWDQPGTLDRIADEVERAQLRLQHRRTLEHVRQDVLAFEGTAPETLSVYLGQLFDHAPVGRSEEHKSELQSLMRISYAVFCWK